MQSLFIWNCIKITGKIIFQTFNKIKTQIIEFFFLPILLKIRFWSYFAINFFSLKMWDIWRKMREIKSLTKSLQFQMWDRIIDFLPKEHRSYIRVFKISSKSLSPPPLKITPIKHHRSVYVDSHLKHSRAWFLNSLQSSCLC